MEGTVTSVPAVGCTAEIAGGTSCADTFCNVEALEDTAVTDETPVTGKQDETLAMSAGCCAELAVEQALAGWEGCTGTAAGRLTEGSGEEGTVPLLFVPAPVWRTLSAGEAVCNGDDGAGAANRLASARLKGG